jgi:hypothetical protein
MKIPGHTSGGAAEAGWKPTPDCGWLMTSWALLLPITITDAVKRAKDWTLPARERAKAVNLIVERLALAEDLLADYKHRLDYPEREE